MAQTVALAPDTGAGNTSNITVADGSGVSVGLYVASGDIIASGDLAIIWHVTPGAPNFVRTLSKGDRSTILWGPNTYYVQRLASPQSIGIFRE